MLPSRSMRSLPRWLVLVLGPIGILLLVAWSYTRVRVRRAEQEMPLKGRPIAAGGTRIHVLERGTGIPVVFIHGSDGVLQDFGGVFGEVAAEHHALAIDRPGHGYSGRPGKEPLTVDLNARMVREVARKFRLGKAVLVGHSHGGAVALRYALDYPGDVFGLVLLAPAAFPPPHGRLPLMFRLPAVPLLGPLITRTLLVPLGAWLMRSMDRKAFSPLPVPEEYVRYTHAFSLRPRQIEAWAEENRLQSDDLAAMAGRYSEIRVPTGIVVGAGDEITPPATHAMPLAHAVPDAELTVLPGVGHEVQWARPDVVSWAIRSVIERSRRGRSESAEDVGSEIGGSVTKGEGVLR